MANRLLMIRHGEYEERYQGSFIGKTDVALSAKGKRQAALLASSLSTLKEATFLCSPMRRTRTTAQVAVGPKRRLEFDENLREIDFGLWETMPFEEIAKGYASLVDQWAAFRDDFAFPQGESLAAFQKRIKKVADRIIRDPSGTVVVFTHGGVIRFLICRLLGIKGKYSLCFDVGTASISEIRLYNGKGVLTRLNDRHHLHVLANEPSKIKNLSTI
jgi:broad specificity phosphatase PhoE